MAAGSIDLGTFGNINNKALLKVIFDTHTKNFSWPPEKLLKRTFQKNQELITNNSTRN